MPTFLSQIIIYPIKSLAGIELSQWQINKKGLCYDRQWMLIDEQNQFLSQRRLPKMALISTVMKDDLLILSAPNKKNISLSLANSTQGETIMSQIWADKCVSTHVSYQIDQWFSDFLGVKCRLVYQADSVVRPVNSNYAKPTDQVNFSDGFPFLIVSQASLDALNRAMGLKIAMARFRPNLVMAHCHAYEEDIWRIIKVGKINFRLPKPCSRCSVPAINPKNADITKEPLTTLSRLRQWQHKVYFGQNALHDNQGVLTVGDDVVIHETGQPQPPL